MERIWENGPAASDLCFSISRLPRLAAFAVLPTSFVGEMLVPLLVVLLVRTDGGKPRKDRWKMKYTTRGLRRRGAVCSLSISPRSAQSRADRENLSVVGAFLLEEPIHALRREVERIAEELVAAALDHLKLCVLILLGCTLRIRKRAPWSPDRRVE